MWELSFRLFLVVQLYAAAEVKNIVEMPTTGVEDIDADNDVPVEYYNLQGVRVDNPAGGVYIRRQGSKVTKVQIQ